MTVKIQNKQHTANDKMNDYIWRPASKIDAPAIFEMRLAVDQVDGTDHAGTLANLEREFEDPWVGDVTKDTIRS